MPIQIVLVPVDPEEPCKVVQVDRADLDAYQNLVGGHIEAVMLRWPASTLYFPEDGKLKDLPENVRATQLAHRHNAIHAYDYIAGPAFVTGQPDNMGFEQSVLPQYIEELKAVQNA